MNRALVVLLALALAGCGGGEASDQPSGASNAKRNTFFVEQPARITSDTPLQVYDAMLERIDYDREAEQVTAMTPGQRALYALNATTDEINNGGFSQYYWNTTGDLAAEAIEGARLVAAKPYEELLRHGARLFPAGEVPKDRAERQELVDSGAVPDAELGALDDRWFAAEERKLLDDYLAAYMRAHADEFFRKEG